MSNTKVFVDKIKADNLYPYPKIISGSPTLLDVLVNGRKVLQFCSNNYLGLADDVRVKQAMINSLHIYGMGSGGSRLVSGTTDVQLQLEKAISQFKGSEAGMTFVAGYMANIGVIPALLSIPRLSLLNKVKDSIKLGSESVIFSDELNHASIIDGCKLAKAKKVIYRHRDLGDLAQKLAEFATKDSLIVTDGVFSMDGDIAPLPEILELAKKYKVRIMVDDAHGSGVIGKNGRGIAEYFNIHEEDLDIVMGTFTKAFGGIGGFVVGSSEVIDYLRITARSYIFTAPIPPVVASGLIESIRLAVVEPDRRLKMWENADYLRSRLQESGFNTLQSQSQIVPVLIGDEKRAIYFSEELFRRGYLVPAIRWPAVSRNQARLRLTVTGMHSKQQIDELVKEIKDINK